MIRGRLNILHVDPDESVSARVEGLLASTDEGKFTVVQVPNLEAARLALGQDPFDVVLLELQLEDSSGIDTLQRLHDRFPALPIVIYTHHGDNQLALQAVRKGAQDVLEKNRSPLTSLPRALIFAYERQHLQERVRTETLKDELTNLYNQRGFYALASEYAELARRTKRGLVLMFIDLDGLKSINDRYGHTEGSRAIMAAGGVLEATFRDEALLARWGGDEFVVLLMDTEDGLTEDTILERLEASLIKFNTKMRRGYDLAMSAGFSRLDPDDPRPLDVMLREADEAMYESKRKRKTLRTG